MNSRIIIDIFAEDRAHEDFIKAIVNRIASEENKRVSIRIRSARGGHGRALKEFTLYQKGARYSVDDSNCLPDLIVVAIDSNCQKFKAAKESIVNSIESEFIDRTVIACPDPHIERWFLADPESFARIIGTNPSFKKKKCERDYYKKILSKAITDSGYPVTLGGIEFAKDIVEGMDMYRAGRQDRSLKHFLDDLKSHLRSET